MTNNTNKREKPTRSNQIISSITSEMHKKHRRRVKARRIFSVMAAFVVFFTTYALVMPALTASADVFCGQQEHTHTSACYEEVLVCNQAESDKHQHTASCYEQKLTCEKEEHTHDLACYANDQADLETAEDWEATLPKEDELTGVTSEDLLAVAKSQIGYTESEDNYIVDEDGKTKIGYSRYGEWNAEPYADWSMDFVAFCLYYTGIEIPVDTTDQEKWIDALDEAGLLKDASEEDFEVGDIVFLEAEEDGSREVPHMGIVSFVSANEVVLIEGDRSKGRLTDGVMEQGYKTNSDRIVAVAALPEDAVSAVRDQAVEKEESEAADAEADNATTLSYTGEDYEVTASFTEEAGLEKGTELVVTEILEDGKTQEQKDYQKYYDQAETALETEVSSARFFDISFEYEGNTVEPAGDVNVTITFDQAEEGEAKAVHLPDGEDAEVMETSTEGNDISFTANSFSVYGVVYTVDFHWEVDGQSYDFSISGGGATTLSDIVEKLGIGAADPDAGMTAEDAKAFVADVENVEFSSPEFVSVSKAEEDTTVGEIKDALSLECEYSEELTSEEIEEIDATAVAAGDWALISAQPFDSEESLTVTMKNGDQFVVKVTDYQNATSMGEFDGATQFVIWNEYGDNCYALRTDGETVAINRNEIDSLGQEFLWTVRFGWEHERGVDYRYIIEPVSNPQYSLTMAWTGQDLVQSGDCGIRFYPHQSQNDVWYLEGWNWTRLYLNPETRKFEVSMGQYTGHYSWVHFSKQEELSQYEFTVQAESTDNGKGFVSGLDKDGINQQAQESYTAITNQNKTNKNNIQASPLSARYMFDYWDLNGETLYWDPATQTISTEPGAGRTTDFSTIPAEKLTIPYNKSTLTAHFKRNPNYVVTDDEKEGRLIDKETLDAWLGDLNSRDFPLNEEGCKKTAELYDYENRIYRVDLTAQSNLSALAGTVDLGFVMDVSASMKFPSKLDMVSTWNNTQTTDNKDWQLQLLLNNINDNYWNKQNWLNTGKEYYIIADKTSTATVDKIKYFQNEGVWKWKDASKNDSNYATIDRNTKFHNHDAAGLTYPIYVDGDNGLTRSHYLESSMSGTLTQLQAILDKINVAANPSQASDALIAYNKFHKDVIDSHYAFVPASTMSFGTYSYDGGTSTDRALADARDFAWSSSAAKYCILITDGAPQRSGNDVPNEVVAAEAARLKNQGVTLITVGLSMGDVKRGSVLLYDIASTDANGDPYFYSAESGDELEYVLLEIIRQIMADAITVGDITDTINEAFYPVDKATGAALTNGNVVDLNGVKIANNVSSLTPEQKKAGYGVIGTAQDGNFTVTWSGQDIPWEGWHGTIYEKAKEDFLGGNAVRTNDPQNPATVVPTGYKVDENDQPIAFKQEIVTEKTQSFNTPRVNVNELNLTENSTEWTVYLGTEVDPKEQLQQLFDNMHAEQVVTNAIDTDGDGIPDTMSGTNLYYPLSESASDQREGEATGTKLSFSLHDVLKKSHGGQDVTIDQLIAAGDEGISWTYDLYGQDNPGKITIKLTKTGETADYDPHATRETGAPVEKYAISVLFTPEYSHIPVGQGGDGTLPYNTGYFGLGAYGNAAGTEEGLNEHLINVFAKKLQIHKVDQSHNPLTKEAKFGLYRKATAAEMEDDSVEKTTLDGLTGSYVLVQELTTTDGTITTEQLPLLPDNEPYYLVETKAPPGYNLLPEILKVTIDMEGHNTWTKISDGSTSQTKPNPYVLSDWLQEATIKIMNTSNSDSAYAVREGNVIYDSVNDTTDASVVYKIINDSGVELPHTGGPGTRFLVLIGALIAAGAGALLIRRKVLG